MKQEIPQTGGTFVRDPATGKLERAADHTKEGKPAEPATDVDDKPAGTKARAK